MEVSRNLANLAEMLERPLYIVGGTCRDALAGLTCEKRDVDICAPISADDFSAAAERANFKLSAAYKNTGTVHAETDGEVYEFTSFRTDSYVRGMHTPSNVVFTDDITADARRRDFKCNAVYYDIAAKKFVDPLGGIADIEARRITTVADADKVFGEDGLRLMRLARIAAQTGFTPTEECMAGAKNNAALICDIAAERVWTELCAILCADTKYGVEGAQYAGLEILKRISVLKYILPELCEGDGMEQRSDFHSYDVLEHSLRCVLYADKSIRLAALLHDIGKPRCKEMYGCFKEHERVGATIAEEVCERLKTPAKLKKEVCVLISLHMYDMAGTASENKVRKFIAAHYDVMDRLLLLKQADYSACKDDLQEAPCVTRWKGIIEKMKSEGVPFTTKQLNVNGRELIEAGVPAQQAGKALRFLLSQAAMGCVPNQKQQLLHLALRTDFRKM